ncbi:MAG: exo-alpha-sialidase [Bacteroidaceae bacterium]|nr:exo-alpha-sialidase [Bacteroidaceae bacterium]
MAKMKNTVLLLLCLLCTGTRAQTYYDGIRICWDYKAQQFLNGGVYSRLKLLSDGTLACAYSAGNDVYLRLCRNGRWGSAIKVASDKKGQYGYTNSELLELADGRLMYAWNARAHSGTGQPYKIMVAYSATKGRTWNGEETLYTAGTEWTDGCWEPAMMQLPDGEVQLFFANEHNIPDNKQNITMLRSTDNCATWEDPVVVSFRPTSRDGMPVPLRLQNGKSLVFAIEDNGLNGNFKPVIIHSSVADNWRGGTVTGSSPHRWSALAPTEELAASVYAGAPYLIQLRSGETLLSCQSSEGRKSADYPIMQAYVGNTQAKSFCCRSTPFPFVGEADTKVQWCALAETSDSTVMATSSVSNRKAQNGIWITAGHICRPMTARQAQGGVSDWAGVPAGLFIGAESQAQALVRSAWDDDSLYLHFQVSDDKVVQAPEGGAAWDSDGIELYLDRNKRGGEKVTIGMYKLLVNVKGECFAEMGSNGNWRAWTNAARHRVSTTATGYEVMVALPWSSIGGMPPKKDMTVFFKLHNNDNGDFVYHENMSGGNPDRPLTWMRCTLSEERVTGITALPSGPEKGLRPNATAFYTLGGRRISQAEAARGNGIYVTKGLKVMH